MRYAGVTHRKRLTMDTSWPGISYLSRKLECLGRTERGQRLLAKTGIADPGYKAGQLFRHREAHRRQSSVT
jgi:hypothetical protein